MPPSSIKLTSCFMHDTLILKTEKEEAGPKHVQKHTFTYGAAIVTIIVFQSYWNYPPILKSPLRAVRDKTRQKLGRENTQFCASGLHISQQDLACRSNDVSSEQCVWLKEAGVEWTWWTKQVEMGLGLGGARCGQGKLLFLFVPCFHWKTADS